MTPWFALVIMLGMAGFFYKAAEIEDLSHPLAWGGVSGLLSLYGFYELGWGTCGLLSLQLVLFLAMGVWMAYQRHGDDWSVSRLKARRHRRQGRCTACGYDLSGASASCPECGEEI